MSRAAPAYLLTRNSRHSIRCRVPAGLAARMGRAEIVRAIGTRDPGIARLILARLSLRLRQLWTLMQDRPSLTDAELRRLANDWLRRELDREWALLDSGEFARQMLPSDLEPEQAAAENARLFGLDAILTEQRLLETPKGTAWHSMDHVAGKLLAGAGHGDRAGSRDRARLRMMLLDRSVSLQEAKQAWVDGNPAHVPAELADPAPPEAPAPPSTLPTAKDGSRTLQEAVDLFIADMRQRRAKALHIKDAMVDFRLLLEAMGAERATSTVRALDAGRLWEALSALPAKYRERPELVGLGVFEAARKARDLGLPPMHHRTMNSYLSRWRGLFQREMAAGQVSDNPFAGRSDGQRS